jgi:hypothetical protein
VIGLDLQRHLLMWAFVVVVLVVIAVSYALLLLSAALRDRG